MPFAINEATAFINPTKALEYMATGRPVVSTAIEDVVLQFADVVRIANSREAFIGMCEQALAAPDHARTGRGMELASRNSWEAIVSRLEGHIDDALHSQEKLEVRAA
jgi:glycosyltransferase involved in cell wall biosynthesis